MTISLEGHTLTLLPQKAIWWEEEGALLIADLHLGKANHFRKAGLAVPHAPNVTNLENLIALLQAYQPQRVLFMGDLFHSHYNIEWESFGQVLSHFPGTEFELIQGNHDIMSDYQYEKISLRIYRDPLKLGNFLLSHEPLEDFEGYNLAGHIHPGVRMRGRGRQSLRLPCFYFGKRQGLMPAFGALTGTYALKPSTGDSIYVIVEGKILQV